MINSIDKWQVGKQEYITILLNGYTLKVDAIDYRDGTFNVCGEWFKLYSGDKVNDK